PLRFQQEFLADLANGLPVLSPIDGVLQRVESGGHGRYAAATQTAVVGDGCRTLRLPVLESFSRGVRLGAAVKAGEPIGYDFPAAGLPRGWAKRDTSDQWRDLKAVFGGRLEA